MTTENLLTLDQAIEKLKPLVKMSAVPGQKHIDFGLVPTNIREDYYKAMGKIRGAIRNNEISEQEFKQKVGLI